MPKRSPDQPESDLVASDLASLLDTAAKQTWPLQEKRLKAKSYRIALGWEPIQLGNIEFHILLFLASRPYHAFTQASIADALNKSEVMVEESSIPELIQSLRDQLGVFHDYVQTVPGVGYRFKQ